MDDVGSGDIRRHEVGSELNSSEVQIEHLSHGVHDEGFRQAGYTGDDAVASHEKRKQHLFDYVVLADNGFSELGEDLVSCFCHAIGQSDVVGRFESYL